jgi:hypothetical protein
VEQAGSYYLKMEASRTDSTSWARVYVKQINNRRAYVLIKPNPGKNGDPAPGTVIDIYIKQ